MESYDGIKIVVLFVVLKLGVALELFLPHSLTPIKLEHLSPLIFWRVRTGLVPPPPPHPTRTHYPPHPLQVCQWETQHRRSKRVEVCDNEGRRAVMTVMGRNGSRGRRCSRPGESQKGEVCASVSEWVCMSAHACVCLHVCVHACVCACMCVHMHLISRLYFSAAGRVKLAPLDPVCKNQILSSVNAQVVSLYTMGHCHLHIHS